jgi:hypothetical protein
MAGRETPLERLHGAASDLHAYAADLQAEHAQHMRSVGHTEAAERAEKLASKERILEAEQLQLAREPRRGSGS